LKLKGLSVRIAAKKINEEKIKKLKKIVERMSNSIVKKTSSIACSEINNKFHTSNIKGLGE